MRLQRDYTTKKRGGKVFTVLMATIFLALVALFVLEVCGVFQDTAWKPDVEISMPNSNVSWEQSYHYGSWGEQS